ncbi:MAG: hypothetical protein SWH61_11260 [Thermodesulfobacteriota bacterium]|nr:hypothetical protein [Thermodesulfobacteriota bacterium]
MEHQYITDKSGVPVSVIIPIAEWEKIQKKIQGQSDTRISGNTKKNIQMLMEKYKGVKPFKKISDPVAWQKGIRDEW